MSKSKGGKRDEIDLFKVINKHLFGLSDHLIQRLQHTISGAGEGTDMDRQVSKIPPRNVDRIMSEIDKIDHIKSQKSKKEQKMKSKDASFTIEESNLEESVIDFRTFLLELNSMQAARQQATQAGLGSQAERRIAGNMSDREFIKKQAEERDRLEQSDDPLDRRILMLKKQLDALYKQKEARQARQQQSTGNVAQ